MIVHSIPSQKMTAWVQKQIELISRDLKNIQAVVPEDQNEARMQTATVEKRKAELETAKATFIFLAKMESVFGFLHDGESLERDYEQLSASILKLEDPDDLKS